MKKTKNKTKQNKKKKNKETKTKTKQNKKKKNLDTYFRPRR